jgi:hypothetical protein
MQNTEQMVITAGIYFLTGLSLSVYYNYLKPRQIDGVPIIPAYPHLNESMDAVVIAPKLEDKPDVEIRKILQCLKANGYEFEGVEDSADHYGAMNASFKKNTSFSESDGNYVNDSLIKVKIQFDSRMDYKNSYENEDGDYEPDIVQGEKFIETILSEM